MEGEFAEFRCEVTNLKVSTNKSVVCKTVEYHIGWKLYHAKNSKFWRTLSTNSGGVTNDEKISFPEFQPSTGWKAFVRMNFYLV